MQTCTKPLSWVIVILFLAVNYSSYAVTPSSIIEGFRLTVTNIEVLKKNEKTAQIYVDIVNTGRFDIETGKDKRLPYLEIDFDESLHTNQLEGFQESIKEKIKSKSMRIGIGQKKPHVFMKVKVSKNYVPINNRPEIAQSSKKSLDKSEPMASIENVIVPQKKQQKEKNILAQTNEKKLSESKKTEKKQSKKKENSKKKKKKDDIVFESPKFENKSLDEVLKAKNECPDLVFENIQIVKKKSKKVIIKFEVKNIGKGPAHIYTKKDKDDQPLAVRAYVSGATEISKGAINIGGFFIEGGLDDSKGMLLPNEKFEMEVELDITKKTRYMPALILSLDSFLKLQECDRTNNVQHILLDK